VGRLDYNTEGLLLLTNDGDLARHIELPSTGWTRRYRVRAYGEIDQAKLDELGGGFRAGGVNYGPIEAKLEREQGDNVWIAIAIREGKNREVRSILEHLGLTVNRLIRVSFGPFMLGDLEPGAIEEVKTAVLKDQLGPRLSRQLGVKREPLRQERRLPPGRSKPTYLRRKPEAPARFERTEEERPPRRRRVLSIDGSAPAIEIPEKKRTPDRFKAGERPERPRRSSRDERPGGEEREARPRRERPERPAGFASDRKPRFPEDRGREDRAAAPRKSFASGDRPRARARDSEGVESRERDAAPRKSFTPGERPKFRARDGEGAEPRPRSRPASAGGVKRASEGEARPRTFAPRTRPSDEKGDRPAWKARHPESGEKADRPAWKARRPEGGEKADRPAWKARSPEGGEKSDRPAWKSRRPEGGEKSDRPAWKSRSPEGGEKGERPAWKARRPEGGERPRSSFRKPQGEGRPFKDRDGGEQVMVRERREDRPEARAPRERRGDEASGGAGKTKTFEKRAFNKGPRREEGAGFKGPKREGGAGFKGPRRDAGAGFKGPRGEDAGKPFREGAAGAKPFKRREGPARGAGPGGPRKPRPKPPEDNS
jgi:23S rRNA pseudouridine2605 synthase